VKITVPGATATDRFLNLTKRLIAVPKSEIDAQAKRYDEKKRRRLKTARQSR
jgi:hypothetical protein